MRPSDIDATLRFHRRVGNPLRIQLRAFTVLVDGRKSLALYAGSYLNLTMSPGVHTIQLTADGRKSSLLNVDVSPNARLGFECEGSTQNPTMGIVLERDDSVWSSERFPGGHNWSLHLPGVLVVGGLLLLLLLFAILQTVVAARSGRVPEAIAGATVAVGSIYLSLKIVVPGLQVWHLERPSRLDC